MCPSGATCLSTDCCFCKLAKRVDLVQSGHHHHLMDGYLKLFRLQDKHITFEYLSGSVDDQWMTYSENTSTRAGVKISNIEH
jgi:hypothetical protein